MAEQIVASIVIPTCNRPDLLQQCLDAVAIAMQSSDFNEAEVVVTDDSIGHETEQLLAQRYSWARWIRGPRRGPASNRNCGVMAARGNWIIFIDDDCIPQSDWLRAYWDAIQRQSQCNVFEGKTVANRQRRRLDEESPLNAQGGYLWSCNMAIKRTTFERLGGFCEGFPHAAMEDVDFRLRLRECAEPFQFVPDALVCHPYRPSKGIPFLVKSGKSYLLLVKRHPQILGTAPWRDWMASCVRRSWHLLRDAVRYRFRGFWFGLTSLIVFSYFDLVARVRCSGAASTNRLN